MLRILRNGRKEKRVLRLRVHDQADEISCLQRFKLLLVSGSPELALADSLIAPSVFDEAFVDRRGDWSRFASGMRGQIIDVL